MILSNEWTLNRRMIFCIKESLMALVPRAKATRISRRILKLNFKEMYASPGESSEHSPLATTRQLDVAQKEQRNFN